MGCGGAQEGGEALGDKRTRAEMVEAVVPCGFLGVPKLPGAQFQLPSDDQGLDEESARVCVIKLVVR